MNTNQEFDCGFPKAEFRSSFAFIRVHSRLLFIAAFLTRTAFAQFYDELDTSGWFIRAGGVARYNVKATLATIAPPSQDPRVYQNGFVQPDIGGGDKTWNWSYAENSQVANGSLAFNRFEFTPNTTPQSFHIDDPLFGAEVIGGYRFSELHIGKTPVRFGLEVGYGYSDFSSSLNTKTTGTSTYRTNFFALNGVVPPLAPYTGTPQGPGPLIPLEPTQPTSSTEHPVSSTQASLDTTFHDFRVGPFFEIDLHRKLSLALGVGYSSVYTDATVHYDQVTTGSQIPIPSTSGTLAKHTWHTGVYAETRLTYRITPLVGIYLGGDIRSHKDHNISDSNQTLNIDLGTTYGAKAGINFQF